MELTVRIYTKNPLDTQTISLNSGEVDDVLIAYIEEHYLHDKKVDSLTVEEIRP